jgi:hypothetical protein
MAFGPRSLRDSDDLDRLAAAYKPGMEVTVHHAPNQPDLAVLVPGEAFARARVPNMWMLLLVPIGGAIVAALFG